MAQDAIFRNACRFLVASVAALAVAAPIVVQAKAPERQRVIVAFKAGGDAGARSAITKLGGRVKLELGEVNAVAVDLPRKAVAELRRSRHVLYVEDDPLQYALARSAPAAADAQVSPYGIAMVQADRLPDVRANNRKVCIIDSGYEATHEDLAGNIVTGENLTTSGDWNTDESQHGTHVGGTISALDNTLGVVGVMPNARVRLHIVKVFDETGTAPSSVIAKAMLRCAVARANVISMSLGGSVPSRVQRTVVQKLAQKNILMIAAAGNDGTPTVSYPAGFPEVVSVGAVDANMNWASFSQFNADVELAAPGAGVLSTVPMDTGTESTLAVGATGYTVNGMEGSPLGSVTGPLADFGLGDTVAPGSMTGKVCLIQRGNIAFSDKVLNCQASGGIGAVIYNNVPEALLGTLGDVVTTIPSVGAHGNDGASLLAAVGQSATVTVSPSNYAVFDGTSMATPHASAVAALVWSYFPTCTAAQIRTSLTNSALDLGPAGRDAKFGFGLVQARAAFDRIRTMGCGV
jgi:subtilisin family serine protease